MMIDSVPDYLFVKDTQSRFVVANRAVADDLDLSVADLIGKTDFDLHPRALAEKYFSDEQSVVETGEAINNIEERLVTATGDRKWLRTSKLPLRAADGQVLGIVGICRDITARKNAEDALAESELRWKFTLESAGQGFWDHNLEKGTADFRRCGEKCAGLALKNLSTLRARRGWRACTPMIGQN